MSRDVADSFDVESAGEKLTAAQIRARVFPYLRPYRWALFLATVLTFARAGLELSIMWLVGITVDVAEGKASEWSLNEVALLLGSAFVLSALLTFSAGFLFAWIGERIVLALRRDLFGKVLSLSLEFFERRKVGELTSRLSTDADVIREIGTSIPVMALRQIATLIGAVVVVTTIHLKLTLILLGILPAVAVITLLLGNLLRRASTAVQDHLASSTAVTEETLAAVETVKTFAREPHEVERYESRLQDLFRFAIRFAVARSSLISAVLLLFYGGLAAVLWNAAKLIESGDLTSGDMVTFVGLSVLVGRSFSALSGIWTQFQRALGAGRRVFQLFEEQPRVSEIAGARSFDGVRDSIRFEGVRFAYPRHPDREVLQGLDFEVKQGEMVALVGESGSGKSTVVSLLLRLYDPTQGVISIDGMDLRHLRLAELREAIAVVPQDISVFGRSLRSNIAYGKLDATEEEILRAAEQAHAKNFIERTANGWDTLAGERGVILSGGERQRIAIARAILKDPSILVLDEATSALDTRSEALVKSALDQLMEGRTTFVIAHRLSTIERADRLLVLHDGQVVETGTHAELLAKRGRYAELYETGLWSRNQNGERSGPGDASDSP